MVKLLKKNQIEEYDKLVIKDSNSFAEDNIKYALTGLSSEVFDNATTEDEELEEVKKQAEVGDFILIETMGRMLPWKVMKKCDDGGLILNCYYLLEEHIFDKETNIWRDCELRRYLNREFIDKCFNDNIKKHIVPTDVHTEDYVTKDRVWIPCHEELGFKDDKGWFKPNVGAESYVNETA